MKVVTLSFTAEYLGRLNGAETELRLIIAKKQLSIERTQNNMDEFAKGSNGFGRLADEELGTARQCEKILQERFEAVHSRREAVEKSEFNFKCVICGGELDKKELLEVFTLDRCANCR